MENKIKTFQQFVNEQIDNELNSEEDALNYLADMGMVTGNQLIDVLSKNLTRVFGVELVENFNESDDELGNYIMYSFEPDPIRSTYIESPTIAIFEDKTAQFYWDATPYPVAANTEMEKKKMRMTQIPAPVKVELFTKEDFDNFIAIIRAETEE